MKTLTIKFLVWLNDFKNEIKAINNKNKLNNLKTNTNILKYEKEGINQEFNVYMDKLRIKQTKNLKNTWKLTIIINALIIISGTFTILGFKLHDMAFKIASNVSIGITGLSLIIGLLLLQYLCFYAESIQTTINERFGRHIKGLNRIKYILIPISVTGTYNFLIDYITFTDIKIINSFIVLMICISIDYSILIFNGIRFDKKHLIFSEETSDIMKDNKSLLHMIIFNLLGDKLLKVRLDYIKKVSTYNKKLADSKVSIEEVSTDSKKLTTLENELIKVGCVNPVKLDIAKDNKIELAKVSTPENKVSNESKKLAQDLKVNTKVSTLNKKLAQEELTYNDKLTMVKHKLKDMKQNESISPAKFKGINITRTEWAKLRSELLKCNLVYINGTSTKKGGIDNKKAL